jgi:two-component system NtrC family sensor kinase
MGNAVQTVSAEELEKKIQQLQTRVQELEADQVWFSLLSQISWTITSTFSLKEILNQIVFFTAELLRSEICVLRLVEDDQLALGAQVGLPSDLVFQKLPTNEGIARWVTREKKPLRVDDIKTHPITREYYLRHGARFDFSSYLGAPLLVRDKIIGILGMYSKGPRKFTETEMEHLAVVANHAAIAIENARTFEAMQRTKQDWVETFDAITDLVFITDTDYTIRRANRAFAEKIGLPFDQIIGKKCYEVVEQTNHPPEHCQQDKMMVIKEPVTVEFDDTRWGGILQITVLPIKNNRNEIIGAVHIDRDITQQKQMQQQLLQSEKLAALGQLISGVAHELNNPLTGVMGYAELLMRKKPNPAIQPAVEKIFKESQRAGKIVQNLLGFVRPHKPEKSYLDIHQILEDTLALREYELRVNHITVHREYAKNLPKTMLDPHQFEHVFLNIIINAESALTDATGQKQGNLTVRTRYAVSEEERIRIEIEDDGPGISRENLIRIFDPFFTTKEVGRGTGLGLSLAYGIVHEHQGTIYAHSEQGQGAMFVIELPILEPKQQKPATVSELEPRKEVLPVKRILVIDDEVSIIDFLQEALQDKEHQVDSANDGKVALQKIMSAVYDMVLCDIKMPGLDGETLYRQVQQENPEIAKRLVFMTGDLINPQTRQFLEQTRVPYLEKPFTIQMICDAMSRILGEK